MSRARRAILPAALTACCLGGVVPAAVARAETAASIHPSLLPDRLGASTALTISFRLSGGLEGVPPPLQGMVVHLPAGLTVDLRGVGACAKSLLQRHGPAGCPRGSLLGRGHAVVKVHAGSQSIPEEATITAFRGPNRGSHPTLEIFGQGETPLYESAISTAVLEPDDRPYGSKLIVSVPPIPTLMYEPDASLISFSLTVGGIGRSPRAHTAAGSILVPRNCPAGGFPFAASFAFADGSAANASATVACP